MSEAAHSTGGKAAGLKWLWVVVVLVALGVASVTLLLVAGAMRDPTRSTHGMLGSAVWTTFGPHLVLLSLACFLTGVAAHRRGAGLLSRLTVACSAAAVAGSAAITTRIVSAAYSAGGSANPVYGLWLRPMIAGGPDHTEAFATVNGQAMQVATYRPAKAGRDAPVLLYIHGGGFKIGSVVETDADLRWFAERGWLVFSVEYRLWTEDVATWDLAPQDIACAAAWVQANAERYGGNMERFAVLGDSAGGNLAINFSYAAALGQVQSECGGVVPVPRAVVVQYPAVDPLAIYEHGFPVPGFEPRSLLFGYLGGDPYALPGRVRAVSSYTYLAAEAPATLVLSPEKDSLVPAWSVYRFVDQARLAGVDVELVRIPFANHVYNQIASNSIGNQARLSITRRYLVERGLAAGSGVKNMPTKPKVPLDEQAIDELYGLEPVFEPGGPGGQNPTEFATVQCPYCGEAFETAVDLSAGSFSYVEDCQVCCQPIELVGESDEAGASMVVTANRTG
jgi:acetyl esterase/lipase